MSDLIETFRLNDQNSPLFNSTDSYVVPLYQRAYAWTDDEINQLIDDIRDHSGNTYFLGTLIVYKKDKAYEVIDGQQRLTTLFLLLNYLGMNDKTQLKFECRDKSNYTLSNLNGTDLLDKMLETNIVNGIKAIENKFATDNINKEAFKEELKNVIIFRIEVPENTDLNRYFEIMNTRGEQLEQHDILKALLMSKLADASKRDAFAVIWEACSDMTGYVQMHVERSIRDDVFYWDWSWINGDSINVISNSLNQKKHSGSQIGIKDIIKSDFNVEILDYYDDKDNRVRFDSIIEFPYFLLHVLKVYIRKYDVKHVDGKSNLINELLDDKKLIDSFNNVLKYGTINGAPLTGEKFAYDFANLLLKCRFLFDRYIIKREYPLNSEEGVWSIKTLRVSGQKSHKKPYYSNTPFKSKNEWEKTYEGRNLDNVMIQSCLRVSYTSPKVMHWITRLLAYLCINEDNLNLIEYHNEAESIARDAVHADFLSVCEKQSPANYSMGVYTPHIVFNYLDYLLWKNNKAKYADFVFEFRNSVEHWYPQHPSDGTFPKWDDVDRFGNLCLVSRNINSKFSNMAPEAKKSTFKDMIAKGSLKLRIMKDLTNDSLAWKNELCDGHEKEMICLFKK